MPSDTSDRPRPLIEIAPRGPYLVSGVETLVDADGRACEAEPNMALCRCGHSGSKPFCDGAHVSHGFTGELRTDFPAKRDHVGRDVTVSYNKSICAHAEYDRGDRTEAYLRERVRFLLSLPNPNLVAQLRRTVPVSRS